MHDDVEGCWAAVQARDPRFDGWFYSGVLSTGIYCRPSCPAVTPKRSNVRFFPTAAAAQGAGLRACKRCRPDAAPGSPEWDVRGDVVARAMRLIADGVVDREGVGGLSRRLGYSTRQLERHVVAELGTGPLALARAQRAQAARILLETTALPVAHVAFAAGFASIRQFNDTIRTVFGRTPGEVRQRRPRSAPAVLGRHPDQTSAAESLSAAITLRLPYRRPLCPDSLFGHLVATAVPGVEEWRDGAYRRTLRLPAGPGIVSLSPADGFVSCTLRLTALPDLGAAVARCRRLLDLDADPVAIDAALTADPLLAPMVAAGPGRRVPRTVDGEELALRAVLGQQVSTAAARTHAGRLAAAAGAPVQDPSGHLDRLFPTAADVAGVEPCSLALPQRRRHTLVALAQDLADGGIDVSPGADRQRTAAQLLALPGLGPWTVATIAMRALGDPDVFLGGDLGIRAAAARAGLPGTERALDTHARCWRPWRSYAVQYLWATLPHAINHIPGAAA